MPVFSSGADNGKGFHRVGRSRVLSLHKPPSLNYFIPKNYIYIPNYKGTNEKKASKSFDAYKSSVGKFLFLTGGYEDAMKTGLLKPISQPDSLQTLSETMETEPTNFASWPSELLTEPRDADLNCIIWKKTKSSSHPKPQKSSRSSVNTYIKSKNRSTGATTFLARTCYKRTRLINGNGNLLSKPQFWSSLEGTRRKSADFYSFCFVMHAV